MINIVHVEMIDVHVLVVSRAHTNCQTSLQANPWPCRYRCQSFQIYIDNHVDNYNGAGSDFFMLCKYESLIKFPILYELPAAGDYEASFLLFLVGEQV